MTRLLLACLALLVVSGCASVSDRAEAYDPWESTNRKTHEFNDKFDKAIAKPIAVAYTKVTPEFVQEGVSNFYSNLDDIPSFLNNFAQGKPKDAMNDMARLIVNTVFGVFGLWDVATPMGFEKHNEDFGQTLGKWGVPPGPYIVLPFLGPSSGRDAPARLVEPSWYYAGVFDENWQFWTWWTIDKVRLRASLLKAENILDQASIDNYAFIRDAWWQRRRNMVYDGNPPREKDE
jgi:phospholipid-binding lipoprotein MlaA